MLRRNFEALSKTMWWWQLECKAMHTTKQKQKRSRGVDQTCGHVTAVGTLEGGASGVWQHGYGANPPKQASPREDQRPRQIAASEPSSATVDSVPEARDSRPPMREDVPGNVNKIPDRLFFVKM